MYAEEFFFLTSVVIHLSFSLMIKMQNARMIL